MESDMFIKLSWRLWELRENLITFNHKARIQVWTAWSFQDVSSPDFRLFYHLNIALQAVLHLSTAALPTSFHLLPESQSCSGQHAALDLITLQCKKPCNKTLFPMNYCSQQERRGNSQGTYSWFSQHGHSWSLLCLVHPDLPGSCTQGHHHHLLHLRRSRFWTVITLPQDQAAARSRSSLFTAWPGTKRAGITARNQLYFFLWKQYQTHPPFKQSC